MALIQAAAWKCEYGDCGHEWLAYEKGGEWIAPAKCAKCRRRKWDRRNGGRGESAEWEQKKADPQRSKAVVLDTPPLGKERPPESSGEKSGIDREDVKKKLMERIPVKSASELRREKVEAARLDPPSHPKGVYTPYVPKKYRKVEKSRKP